MSPQAFKLIEHLVACQSSSCSREIEIIDNSSEWTGSASRQRGKVDHIEIALALDFATSDALCMRSNSAQSEYIVPRDDPCQ